MTGTPEPAGRDVISAAGYDVEIAPGLLSRVGDAVRAAAPAHRYALVTDTTVAPLYADAIAQQFDARELTVATVPAGETHKTRATWSAVTDQLLGARLGRDTTVISLGGGVVCDLAGFVAATYMRGVPVVHVPTTLLAMIDASIGGKTGVDTPGGKNLVGAFHQPSRVLVDPQVLGTLPLTEIRAGFAEALKHGAMSDARYFQYLKAVGPILLSGGSLHLDDLELTRIIRESVRIKTSVVGTDERESGARKTLNFGHTVGHAIEHASGYAVRHGEGVAIGMVVETTAAELAGITERGTAAELRAVLESVGLPAVRPAGLSPQVIVAATSSDKKARGGSAEYAVPARIGTAAGAAHGFAVRLDDAIVLEALA